MVNIAINGFGRIGRLLFRQMYKHPQLKISAVNDLGDAEDLAYVLQRDSVYGPFEEQVSLEDGALVAGKSRVRMLQEKDASKLPWKDLAIGIVVEATGVFESYEKARVHLQAGAKRVVITAPAKDEDTEDAKTVLMGVNEEEAAACLLTSNGSCTTNAASPVIQILQEELGIEKALLNTAHGYTATQNLVDGAAKGKDFRRGRAAALNIVPSSTGAAISVAKAIPSLQGKFDGIALRVPVIAGSIADITFLAKRKTSVEEVNAILAKAAESPRWKGILKVTHDQLVSTDILKEPYGAIVDLNFTRVVDGDLVKVLSWYDNEWGYVATLVKHIEMVAKTLS
ncbi:MAG: type I glyceraldehyde-3-phosphate dehydrogenase [Candidatus Wildermuthbacteria bacterium]|nr:type I glyceraldehyde-3-phosphate dehydrogenase [Candidatus Wildermuthbacteria bacterium]